MAIEWSIKKFEELDVYELYAILQLRNEVFVVEQNCVFQDADDKDASCYHCQGKLDGKLVTYARIAPPGIIYNLPGIGRVVTAASVRKGGVGRALIEESIRAIEQLFGKVDIKIGAQVYLLNFYKSFGFEPSGAIYLEDGIDHVHMIRPFPVA